MLGILIYQTKHYLENTSEHYYFSIKLDNITWST